MAPMTNQQRKLLKQFSDALTIGDVGSMKFVCRDKIGAALLERVGNDKPHELFQLLEQKGLIMSDNLSWLREIFIRIQRFDLAEMIPGCPERQDSVDGGYSDRPLSSPLSPGISRYRSLLKELADELTNNQVDEIKFLLNVPGGLYAKIQDGQSLLVYMEEHGHLSENNLAVLKDVLSDVHRVDLIQKIEKFTNTEAQVYPLPQQMSSPTSTYLMRPEDFLSTVSVPPQEPFPSYPMKQPPGHALIINIQTFSGRTPQGHVLNERKGTQVDLDNLTDLWKQLGFVVQKHTNLKAHQIVTVVQDLAKAIDNSASCFVCCIMTHGMLGSIYGSDSKPVKIGDITGFFKEKQCKALAGKPKLFFIQACRGQNKLARDSLSAGMPETNLHPDAIPTDEDKQDESFRHSADPNESHFLLGYATPPGYVSWRSTQHGSWYVNALVETFRKYFQQEDVLSMMVRVNGKVSDAYTKQGYKQCPAPVVTLTKHVYFKLSAS